MEFSLDSHRITHRAEEDASGITVFIVLTLNGSAGEAVQLTFGEGGETVQIPAGSTPSAYLDKSRFADYMTALHEAMSIGSVTVKADIDAGSVNYIQFSAVP